MTLPLRLSPSTTSTSSWAIRTEYVRSTNVVLKSKLRGLCASLLVGSLTAIEPMQ